MMNWELFSIFSVPWILDLIGGRAIMATLFGSFLWGAAVILVSARAQIRDQNISKVLLLFTWGLSGAWISYWLFAFANEPQHQHWLGKPLQWLAWTHAGLLTAGAAFISVCAVFSIFWLWGERRIHRGSWQRRSLQVRLPSLEASSRITLRSLIMGVFAWTCGLLLAATNGFIQWNTGVGAFANETDNRWSWAQDSKFVVGVVLWTLLLGGLAITLKTDKNSKWRFVSTLLISAIFLAGFYCLLTLDIRTRHLPVRWFVK